MKLAFLNDGIYAYASGSACAVGGAERQQWLLAQALTAAGWSVTVGVRDMLKPGERKVINGWNSLASIDARSFWRGIGFYHRSGRIGGTGGAPIIYGALL